MAAKGQLQATPPNVGCGVTTFVKLSNNAEVDGLAQRQAQAILPWRLMRHGLAGGRVTCNRASSRPPQSGGAGSNARVIHEVMVGLALPGLLPKKPGLVLGELGVPGSHPDLMCRGEKRSLLADFDTWEDSLAETVGKKQRAGGVRPDVPGRNPSGSCWDEGEGRAQSTSVTSHISGAAQLLAQAWLLEHSNGRRKRVTLRAMDSGLSAETAATCGAWRIE